MPEDDNKIEEPVPDWLLNQISTVADNRRSFSDRLKTLDKVPTEEEKARVLAAVIGKHDD